MLHAQRLADAVRETGAEVYGIEYWRGGVLEWSWGEPGDKRHGIYSATKAVTALAVGMAEGDGLLDLHAPLTDFFPELKDLEKSGRSGSRA